MSISPRSFFSFAVICLCWLTRSAECIPTDDTPPDIVHFQSELQPEVGLRFVRNSGVCETTPGVGQISGYADIGKNMSMWFWFFESRENPETAPFTLWINGGPGSSSMVGVFQEHGPCQVLPDGKTTVTNPFSWNNISNMIYIDQPIGTGFSHGTIEVNSTVTAAPPFWSAFQALLEMDEFKKFESREFVFATESYGGHYGPEFVTYFNEQNAKIDKGEIKGKKITVSALMINNGWFDPLIQNQAYLQFTVLAPGYGRLQNDSVIEALNDAFFGDGGCQEQEKACYAAGTGPESDDICSKADAFCIANISVPAVGDRDSDDLRQNSSALFPPEYYLTLLHDPTVLSKIGVDPGVNYTEFSIDVAIPFGQTGDDARTFLPQLGALVNTGLRTLIWAGDADINCNWVGVHTCVLAMEWFGNETLHNTPFSEITLHGEPVAAIQNVGNFTFARVFEAGHEVAAFQPEVAFEFFSQVLRKEQIHSA